MKYTFEPLTLAARQTLSKRTGVDFTNTEMKNWFCVSAWTGGRCVGAIACEPRSHFDWNFNLFVDDHRCVTRKVMRVFFGTLFTRAVRVTAEVDPSNDIALKQIKRLGFIYEGFRRLGIEGKRDAYVFGMLAEDCPWIRPRPHQKLVAIHRAMEGQVGLFS